MEKYIGVKMIKAEPAFKVTEYPVHGSPETKVIVSIDAPETHGSVEEGYKVVYPDGYESWSPKDVFEEAYRKTSGLTFGLALEALKKGFKVARSGWNGKGMYIQYNKARDFEFSELCPFLTIKNVRNSFDTWVPSISDLMAEDWQIVE